MSFEKSRKIAFCGNSDCRCSTGVHEGLSFGSGRLDKNGFWEYPCRICSRHFQEVERVEIIEQLRREGYSEEAIGEMEWLQVEAWPFEGQDCADEAVLSGGKG